MTPHPALCMLTGDFLVNLLNLGGRGPDTEPAGEEGRAGEEREAGVRDVLLLHTFQNFEWPTSLIQNLLLASWLCRYLMLASCTHASLNLELLSSMSVDSLS